MKNIIILSAYFICLVGCNQQNGIKKDSEIKLPNVQRDTIKNEIEKSKDTLQKKSLYPGSDTLFFTLKMDSANKHISIPVTVSLGKELFATLFSSDKKANIRISQIGFPDSTFDGPFGKSLQYKIKAPGNYKIIIGENMMAGDPWKGDFVLKAWVK